jgi:hypothetical protein
MMAMIVLMLMTKVMMNGTPLVLAVSSSPTVSTNLCQRKRFFFLSGPRLLPKGRFTIIPESQQLSLN